MKPPPCFEDKDTRKIIDQLCADNRIDVELLENIVEIVQNYSGSGRKESVTFDINQCISNFIYRTEQ